MNDIRILYVEDEPFLARIVKESLESRGFEVHLSTDGMQGLEMFRETNPHICVLDIMLPHKDGLHLAREIKQERPQTPIIFLTAKTQTEDLIRGFKSGGNDYLRKPFSMEELIVRIQNLLSITSPAYRKDNLNHVAGERIVLGKYVFLPGRYELHLGNEIRNLSHRETQLLKLLTQNTEEAVLRRDLLLKIWGDDSFANSRNLDVYISRIRDYLAKDPSIRIQTLKGVGYHFQMPE